jgi:hypothetical protein
MKALILCAALASASFPALAQTNVSITVGQPGFYGRLDIGDFGPPPVYMAQPVIIERYERVRAEPVYLRVPPGHRKNWSKHCRKYGACGQPVLFVQDSWYSDVYAPRYREQHVRYAEQAPARRYAPEPRYDERYEERGKGKDKGHGNGHGKGHGNGKGRGHD